VLQDVGLLAGKRFALIGFEAAEAESIGGALSAERAFGHVIGADASHPRLNSLAPFDACIVNASAPAGSDDQPSPLDHLTATRKPAIIIGSPEELLKQAERLVDRKRDFVIRPYERDELLLRAYLVLRLAEDSIDAMPVMSKAGGRRVAVLADDDQVTIVLISTILKHFDFDCLVANSGPEALAMVKERKPDLVLLDISMPQMSGFDALTALRSNPATRDIPVMLVTSHHDEANLVKGFALGADDYVTKPFNSGELMARINHVLREPD
jgi:CheY-like chemotaxis protein